jgi:hypothetical protein
MVLIYILIYRRLSLLVLGHPPPVEPVATDFAERYFHTGRWIGDITRWMLVA